MRKLFTIFLLIFAISNVIAQEQGIFAQINISSKPLIFKLHYQKAPLAVCNFIALAEGKKKNKIKGEGISFYNGMIATMYDDKKGISIGNVGKKVNQKLGYVFPGEFDDALKHDRVGQLSFITQEGPYTQGSQFIILRSTSPVQKYDGQFTVFGSCVKGQEHISKIKENDVIDEVFIHRYGESAKAFKADEATFKKMLISKYVGEDWKSYQILPSGMMVKKIQEGNGPIPNMGRKAVIHYIAYDSKGNIIKNTRKGKPEKVVAGMKHNIPGWEECFKTMKVGDRKVLVLPPFLAYGNKGIRGVVQPGAVMMFDLELIGID